MSDVTDEDEKRVSITLIGANRIEHPKFSNLADVFVTQTCRSHLIVQIPEDGLHLIFYNSATLRLPALKRRLAAIVPREKYNAIAAKLEGASLGSVFSDGYLNFLCVETTDKTSFSPHVVVKTVRIFLEKISEDNPVLYYLSNGNSAWRIKMFSILATQVRALSNYVVSVGIDNFAEDLETGPLSRTKAGQSRSMPLNPRGEVWPHTIYNRLHKIRLLNPDDEPGEPGDENILEIKKKDLREVIQEEVNKKVAKRLAQLEAEAQERSKDASSSGTSQTGRSESSLVGCSSGQTQAGPAKEPEHPTPVNEDQPPTILVEQKNPKKSSNRYPKTSAKPDKEASTKQTDSIVNSSEISQPPQQPTPDVEAEPSSGSKRQASPLPEADLRDASQQTTLPHKKRPIIVCPVQKNPQEQLLDSLTQKLDDDYGQFDASDSEDEQSLVDCSHSDVIAFSSQPGRGYACNPVIESPDQVCYRTRNRIKGRTEAREKLKETNQLMKLRRPSSKHTRSKT